MADLQSLRKQRNLFGDSRSPFNGWVYESNYKMFVCDPDGTPDSRAKFDSVGHRMMNAINPNWVVYRSHTGQIMMLVDGNRWDAASIKQTMDEQVYQATAEDTVWTVTESTGAWTYNSFDGVTHGTDSGYPVIDINYSYWRSGIVGSVVYEANAEDELEETIQLDITNANPNTFLNGLNSNELAIWNAWQSFPHNNWNLGNYFDGTDRYNEFPLDVPMSFNNMRMFEVIVDAMNDWITANYGTDANEENDMDEIDNLDPDLNSQLWRAGSPLASVLSAINPICWTFRLKGTEDDAVDQKSANIVFMTDNATSMEDVWQKLESSIKANNDNNGPDPKLVVNPYWGYRPA